jgi:hypothetical protein
MSLTSHIVRMISYKEVNLSEVKIPVPAGLIVQKSYKTRQQKAKEKEKAKAKKLAAQGRRSRAKGHGFEREIAIQFRKNGYPRACRQLEYQEGKGIDLANTGLFDVQCKRTKKYTSFSAINEIPREEGRVPLLIAKEDYGEVLVAMPLDYFFELINNQKELKNVESDPTSNSN